MTVLNASTNTLTLLLIMLLGTTLTEANQSTCKTATTAHCILSEALQSTVALPQTSQLPLIMEIAFEANLTGDSHLYHAALQHIKRISPEQGRSLESALQTLQTALSKKTQARSISTNIFPTAELASLADEEMFLHAVNNKLNFRDGIFEQGQRTFTDSLGWSYSNYYYLSLIRDVELKTSKALKQTLIRWLSLSPKEQHQHINLSLALMETIGGALKIGESTRKTSNVNAFSHQDLNHLNQRVIFYRKFSEFYNKHIGLQKQDCLNPQSTTNDSISLFFNEEHKPILTLLENISVKSANDFLISGSIIHYLNACTPIGDFFLQRFLNETQISKTIRQKILYIRAYRRFSGIQSSQRSFITDKR